MNLAPLDCAAARADRAPLEGVSARKLAGRPHEEHWAAGSLTNAQQGQRLRRVERGRQRVYAVAKTPHGPAERAVRRNESGATPVRHRLDVGPAVAQT